MDNTIAILTEKGYVSNNIWKGTLNIFRMKNGQVCGYESVEMEEVPQNNFYTLLKMKNISLVYIATITREIRGLLEKINVHVKCPDEWQDDRFIHQFIFAN